MSTSYTTAATRNVRFENVTLTELKLTKNSYYKIILQESSGTSIVELLNGQIYTVTTPSSKTFKIAVPDGKYDYFSISNLSSPVTLNIDYFEEFELNPDTTGLGLTYSGFTFNTSGNMQIVNFAGNTVTAENLAINNAEITNLVTGKIVLGQWEFTADTDGKVKVSLGGS